MFFMRSCKDGLGFGKSAVKYTVLSNDFFTENFKFADLIGTFL